MSTAKLFSSQVTEAKERIKPYIRKTPSLALIGTSLSFPWRIFLKLELLQVTGSFKPRGALNRLLLLSKEERKRGVVAASGGNHGLGVAYAAKVLEAPAHIFVPESAPKIKREKIQSLGATLHLAGTYYHEAYQASQEYAQQKGYPEIHAYDHVAVIAGQGTVGLEFFEDCPNLDLVLVAVGGGGLISGVAAYFHEKSPNTKIVGVEPSGAATLYRALEAERPVRLTNISSVAADSLGAQSVGSKNFEIAKKAIHKVILVEDEDILTAQKFLWKELRLGVELGGATAMAALLSKKIRLPSDAKIGILVCGSNMSQTSDGGM